MGVEIVLAALEEYFSLKRDLGDDDQDGADVEGTRDRAVRALNAYIDLRFSTMMLEEKRKVSTITKRMKAVDPNTKVSWDGVSAAVDALNAPPTMPKNILDAKSIERFKESYEKWYNQTRKKALLSILPDGAVDTGGETVPAMPKVQPIELNFNEDAFFDATFNKDPVKK